MGITVVPPPVPLSTIGGTSGTVPVNLPPSTPQSATAAVNTAVVITIAAVAGQSVRLNALSAAYTGAPAGGSITITSNAVTLYQGPFLATTLAGIPLPDGGLEGASGFSMVITLAAAGAAVVGSLNVASYYGS
jgi:hypothetical protein